MPVEPKAPTRPGRSLPPRRSRTLGPLLVLALLFAAAAALLAPITAGADERTVSVGGESRSYILHLPRTESGRPHPVLVAFHPGGATADWMERTAPFHLAPGAEDYVVVYPEGTRRTFNAGVCCGTAVERGVDDVAFFRAILADLRTIVSIRDKAYVTGFSNGAMMNFRLMCEAPELIAAAAPFAGSAPMDNCVSGYSIPVLYMNGSEDRVALEGGRRQVISRFQSTSPTLTDPRDALAAVARRNSCGNSMGADLRIDVIDSTCESFQGCPQGAPVRFCVIPGLGHAWPGGAEPRGRLRQAMAEERFGPYRPELNGTGTVVWFFNQY